MFLINECINNFVPYSYKTLPISIICRINGFLVLQLSRENIWTYHEFGFIKLISFWFLKLSDFEIKSRFWTKQTYILIRLILYYVYIGSHFHQQNLQLQCIGFYHSSWNLTNNNLTNQSSADFTVKKKCSVLPVCLCAIQCHITWHICQIIIYTTEIQCFSQRFDY